MTKAIDFEQRFRRTCPSCDAPRNGFLIRQRLLEPAEVHYMVPQATERTIRRWMREWCPDSSGILPSRRAPAADARKFVLAVEANKIPYGAARMAPRQRRISLQTKCSNCGASLGGFVAPLAFRDAAALVPDIGGGLVEDTIHRWIKRGLLRAFRLSGIRGPLFDSAEFEQDFARVRDQYLWLTRLAAQAARSTEEEGQ